MPKPLNILIVEDSPDDAELALCELRRAGFEPKWKRVETELDFLSEIAKSPDIILSDYSMPRFSGLRAVELLRKSSLDIPFILISGTVGEDIAVEVMKQGVTDYLLKDRMARLGIAVERALEEKRLRDEHNRVEEAQRISYARYRKLFDYAPDGIVIAGENGVYLDANPSICRMLGYTREELVGLHLSDIVAQTEIPNIAQALTAIKARQNYHREWQFRRKDGSVFDAEVIATPMPDGNLLGVIRDTTERMLAEKELHWKTALLGAQLDSSLDGILVVDEQGRKILQNQRLSELWKIPPHIAGNKDDAVQVAFVTKQVKNSPQFVDKVGHLYAHPDEVSRDEIELIDGTILDRYSAPVRDQAGKYYGRIWAFRDMTERKRVEQALRQEEALLTNLLNSVPDHIYFKDRQSRFLRINEAMARRFKLRDAAAALGKTDFDLFSEEHARQAYNDEQRIMETGEPMIGYEEKETWPDGRITWASTTKMPLRDREGRVTGLVGISRDITERKHGEEALQESQALYHSLVDELPVGIFRKDRAGRYVFANSWFCRLRGLQLDHILGRTPDELVALEEATHGQTRPEVLKSLREGPAHHEEIMRTGKPLKVEEVHPTAGGGKRYLHVLKSAVFGPNGKIMGTQGVQFDITDQRKLEEQFRQSQKMEAIGELAGGVAHDFNNILAVIQMHADLMKNESQSSSQIEFIEEVTAAAARGAALTRQLLLFSRKETMHLRDLDLNESINNMTKMLRRTIGENIQIQFKFAMQSLMVHADAGMIDQVLMNLAVNARDAMPQGGRLIIETSAVEFDESAVSRSAKIRPGSFACLSVSDNGCGIPPENLTRIFEPFFTTKEVGKGTGLGLATVFGIVQQHHGWINAYSEVGRGTTFRIYLPRLATVSGQKMEPPLFATLPRGDETILLVEDDSFVRNSVRRTLSQLGYQVIEATNGTEALETWKKKRDQIRLVLTDMVMPGGMNGKELGERLLKQESNLKLIYMSGYSAEVAERGLLVEEGVDFLTKPFPAAKLALTVRARLDH